MSKGSPARPARARVVFPSILLLGLAACSGDKDAGGDVRQTTADASDVGADLERDPGVTDQANDPETTDLGAPDAGVECPDPDGFDRVWMGGAAPDPQDWSDPANWRPEGVPTAEESALVCDAPNTPELTSEAAVGTLWIADSMTLDLGAFELVAAGDVRAGVVRSGATGRLRITGVDVDLEGQLPNLAVTGQVLLSGATVSAELTISAEGELTIAGQQLDVLGDLEVDLGAGADRGLVMTDPADRVRVSGTAEIFSAVAEADSSGNLTAGRLELAGDLTQRSDTLLGSPLALVSTGTTVAFVGESGQTVHFEDPGASASRLHDVEVAAGADVTLTSSLHLTGQLQVADGGRLTQGEGLEVELATRFPEASAGYDVARTVVVGPLTLEADAELPNQGDLAIVPGGSLQLDGHTLQVSGSLEVRSAGPGDGLFLTASEDVARVLGDATFTGEESAVDSATSYTAGRLEVGGDLRQESDPFDRSGRALAVVGTQIRLIGDGPQLVSFEDSGLESSFLADVIVSAQSDVTFASDVVVTGQLRVEAGGRLTQVDTFATSYLSALPDAGDGYQVAVSQIAGEVTLTEAATLPSGHLVVIPGGRLVLGGHTLEVNGDLTVVHSVEPGDGVVLTEAADELVVTGDVELTTDTERELATTSEGNLTDGVLRVQGDFSQRWILLGSRRAFVSTGTAVVLEGSASQQIELDSSDVDDSRFADLTVANTGAGAVLLDDGYLSGGLLVEGVFRIEDDSVTLEVAGDVELGPGARLENVGEIRYGGSYLKDDSATVVGNAPVSGGGG